MGMHSLLCWDRTQTINHVIYFKKQEEMSNSACEYIIYTPGQKQNVILLHTVIAPSPGPRQLILFVLPMKFCTQMEQNRDPVELAELLFLYCSISFFFFFFLVFGYLLAPGWFIISTHKFDGTQTHARATP